MTRCAFRSSSLSSVAWPRSPPIFPPVSGWTRGLGMTESSKRIRPMARTNKRAEKPGQQEGLTDERSDLKLSEAQRRTVLKYAELPAHLANALSGQGAEQAARQFTLDELDELLDRLELAVYRAKGNEKQRVLRIVRRVAPLPHIGIERIPISAAEFFQRFLRAGG